MAVPSKDKQTKGSSTGLSNKTKEAQKALSEKYGVATFDTKGNISTVPTTRPLNPNVDVGTGRYDKNTFESNVNAIIESELQAPITPPSAGETLISSLPTTIESIIETVLAARATEEMPSEQAARLEQISVELAKLEQELAFLATSISKGNISARAEQVDTQRRRDLLIAERDKMISSSVLERTFADLVKLQIKYLQELVSKQPMTASLKSDIKDAMTETNKLLTQIANRSVSVDSTLLLQIGKTMDTLRFRLDEQIGAFPLQLPGAEMPKPTPAPKPKPPAVKPTDPVTLALSRIYQTIFGPDQINDYAVENIPLAIQGVFNEIFKFAQEGFSTYLKLLSLDKPIDIDKSPEVAAKLAFSGLSAGYAIYAAATASDLLHPLKGTGIVPAAIDITRGMGTDLVSHGMIGTFANIGVISPLTKYYNNMIRPFRPSGSIADQMYFEGHITIEIWKKLYAWQGWPDSFINAWQKTMFIEPTDRLLISMFEDPEIAPAWIRQKLKERGYNDDDIKVLGLFAKNRAIDKTRTTRQTILISRYKKGYMKFDQIYPALQAAEFRKDQIDKIVVTANLERDTAWRDLSIDAYTEMYQNEQISETDYENSLKFYIPSDIIRGNFFMLQKSRREAKLKKAKARAASEGTTSTLITSYAEGMFGEDYLREQLALYNKDPVEIDIAVTEAKLKARLDNHRAAVANQRLRKAKVETGRSTFAINRFVSGYISESAFEGELKSLNLGAQDIIFARIEAYQQRDTKFRQKAIDNLEDLYLKDLIGSDILEAELGKYVQDKTVIEQIVEAANIRKYKKPKDEKIE